MTVESLKSLFDVLAVALLFLTFAAGLGVLVTGRIVDARQKVQIRKFDADLTAAKTELGKQQERAANAESELSGVVLELEKQKEATANAEKTLLELSERQGSRFIKNHSLMNALKGKPTGSVQIWYQPNDPEAYWYATDIAGELLGAGWTVPVAVPIPSDVSFATFMPPEYHAAGVEKLDQLVPPVVRITGGNAELTLLSNAPDKGDSNSTITILSNALKPLVHPNFGWRPATTLPDNHFILVVGPKP